MKLLSILLLTFLSTGILAQEKAPRSINVLTKTGFLMAHRAQMAHLVKGLNSGLEIEFTKQRPYWDWYTEAMKWPVQGFSISYQDFGNAEVLGKAFGLIQFTKFNLWQHEKFGFLDMKLGSGLSYITKEYDPDFNKKNNAIGSNINHLISLQVNWENHFKHINLGIGLGINHYSNASANAPNLGLNTPLLHLQLGFNTAPRQLFEPYEGPVIAVLPRYSNNFQFSLITSFKQNLPGANLSKFMPVIALQGTYRRYVNLKWDLEGSLDLIYNEANRHFYDTETYSIGETFQAGATVGAAYNFFKSQIYFGVGSYFYNVINPAGFIYNRVGYRYKFGNRLRMFCGIKAHLGKADYMEFGVAYVL